MVLEPVFAVLRIKILLITSSLFVTNIIVKVEKGAFAKLIVCMQCYLCSDIV